VTEYQSWKDPLPLHEAFGRRRKVWNPTHGYALGNRRGSGREKKMWLALAAITLAAAVGFNILALAIQYE